MGYGFGREDVGESLLRAIALGPSPVAEVLAPLVERAWKAAITRDFPVLLPLWSAQAVGQPTPLTLDVAAAWSGLYLAAKLLDDLQDGDPSILGPSTEAHTDLNVATALLFACCACLGREGGHEPTRGRLLVSEFARYGLAVTAGQERGAHMDESADPLEWAWQVLSAKGGRPFSLACRAGALSAGAGGREATAMTEVGMCIGEMIQLLDDLIGLGGDDPADLRTGSMALAYGLSVAEGADAEELAARLAEVRSGRREAVAGVYAKLQEMGADRYLRLEASARAVKARQLLLDPTLNRASSGWTALADTVAWLDPVGRHGPAS